MDYLIIIYK